MEYRLQYWTLSVLNISFILVGALLTVIRAHRERDIINAACNLSKFVRICYLIVSNSRMTNCSIFYYPYICSCSDNFTNKIIRLTVLKQL